MTAALDPRMLAASLLVLLLFGLVPAARAGHEAPPAAAAPELAMIPVEAMPPLLARAYVLGIQEELAGHGYDPGTLDGRLSRATLAAIRRYQFDAGLPVDGVASKALLDHLKFVLPKVYAARAGFAEPWPGPGAVAPELGRRGGYLPDPVIVEELPGLPSSTPVPLTPPSLSPAPAPVPAPNPGPETRRTPGAGGVVTQVQEELAVLGYYQGPATGRFGPETAEAARRFQRDNGLPATGVIDGALLGALLPDDQSSTR